MAVGGNDPRVTVAGLGIRLGETRVLDGVDLKVSRGELLVVVGPNGAGKSTLLRCIDGLIKPDRGEIRIDGRPLGDYPRRDLARAVSFVPQTEGPAAETTVRSYVEMGRYPHLKAWGALTAEDRRAVDEALELTTTGRLEHRSMATLSGGERQRVGIAAALAQGGTILLLDEPTSFLDYRHQVQILDMLDRLHTHGGYTVVAVTHDLNGLVAGAASVLALVDGRVEFSGPPESLFDGEVLAGIYGNEFILVPGGRNGLPLVAPARNGS